MKKTAIRGKKEEANCKSSLGEKNYGADLDRRGEMRKQENETPHVLSLNLCNEEKRLDC